MARARGVSIGAKQVDVGAGGPEGPAAALRPPPRPPPALASRGIITPGVVVKGARPGGPPHGHQRPVKGTRWAGVGAADGPKSPVHVPEAAVGVGATRRGGAAPVPPSVGDSKGAVVPGGALGAPVPQTAATVRVPARGGVGGGVPAGHSGPQLAEAAAGA